MDSTQPAVLKFNVASKTRGQLGAQLVLRFHTVDHQLIEGEVWGGPDLPETYVRCICKGCEALPERLWSGRVAGQLYTLETWIQHADPAAPKFADSEGYQIEELEHYCDNQIAVLEVGGVVCPRSTPGGPL